MRDEEDKLSPDELLKAIKKKEQQKVIGRLKIFFGMSAGVGKTFSMLDEAQQKKIEGLNVVIGTINTHGRKDTEAKIQSLPLIPEKWIKYKDTVFEEMDLEAIIAARPDIVLVDELAHTNVPGAKHPKRWQDVIELLDEGIDVYTTLNVQHLESRKDIVESLTGIQVRETVPDLILERATSIELIDLPPPELLKRLHEGKVYLGDQSKVAAEHFFTEENLMALREIALRFTAEKVDHDLHGILQGKGWKNRERVMVAISPSPSSEELIRSARRVAFRMDAPWIVVYVDRGIKLNNEDQTRLNKHFILARELGADVITTQDLDVFTALQRLAKQKDITRIIIGRSAENKSWFMSFFGNNFYDRLVTENKNVDVLFLRQDVISGVYQRSMLRETFTSKWIFYLWAFFTVAIATILGEIIVPYIGYKAVGFIYLLGILILGFFVGRGPVFFAALLSTMSWENYFIPPLDKHEITEPEDIALVIFFFGIATLMGTITSRLREQDQLLKRREEKIEHLYEIERDIANAPNLQYLRLNVSSRLENLFPGKFDILVKGADEKLIIQSQLPLLSNERETAAANWVFQNGKIGGWSTDTLPSAEGIYFPIKQNAATVGVLVYFPQNERTLSIDEMNFIQTVAQQLGVYIERNIYEARISRQDYTRQIERLYQSIFHSFDRSFYEPLEETVALNQQIKKAIGDSKLIALTNKMDEFLSNLKVTIDNIILIAELDSGFVHFDPKESSMANLIEACIADVKPLTNTRKIEVEIPNEVNVLLFDSRLLRHAINNLLLNAIRFSPAVKPIQVKVSLQKDTFQISVIDQGQGIPDEVLPLIFDKFYHEIGKSKGLGLGLAIVKSVVAIHQGKIEVNTEKKQGTEFSLVLPLHYYT